MRCKSLQYRSAESGAVWCVTLQHWSAESGAVWRVTLRVGRNQRTQRGHGTGARCVDLDLAVGWRPSSRPLTCGRRERVQWEHASVGRARDKTLA